MESTFTNEQIKLSDLPRYETLAFESVSRKLLTKTLINHCLWLVIVVISLILWYSYRPQPLPIYLAAAFLLLFGVQCYLAFKLQKSYGYALREKDIVFKRGFIFRKTTIIPFNRIQHVSTSQGILDKMFHIAILQLFTAGGSGSDINIPGLEPQRAEVIKEAIVKKVINAS